MSVVFVYYALSDRSFAPHLKKKLKLLTKDFLKYLTFSISIPANRYIGKQ